MTAQDGQDCDSDDSLNKSQAEEQDAEPTQQRVMLGRFVKRPNTVDPLPRTVKASKAEGEEKTAGPSLP